MGFNSDADVRFSDGVTTFTMIQAFYNEKDGRLVKYNVTSIAPLAKNSAGTVHAQTSDIINTAGFKIKVFLWNQDLVPLVAASSEWTEFD